MKSKIPLRFLVISALSLASWNSAWAATVLTEAFTYADGLLTGPTAVPGSQWSNHSGTVGQADVLAGVLNLTSSESEDINSVLSGSLYSTGTLTATFTVNFSALPTSTGTYFAHFKDNTTSGFRGRVYASTTGAATGSFRLGISNSNNSLATTVFVPTDLSIGTIYTITTQWNLDTLVATLSIDGGTAVSATDTLNNTGLSIQSFAFRQGAGIGTSTIDNLAVDYVPEPATAVLGAVAMLSLFRRRR